MSTSRTASFPFMTLPPELRLCVYERLPRRIHHYRINLTASDCIILVRCTTETAILGTCKKINNEAKSTIQQILNKFILEKPPQLCAASDQYGLTVLETIMSCAVKEAERLGTITDIFKQPGLLSPGLVQRLWGFDNIERLLARELEQSVLGIYASSFLWIWSTIKRNILRHSSLIIRYIAQAARQLLHNQTLNPAVRPHFQYVGIYDCEKCYKHEEENHRMLIWMHCNPVDDSICRFYMVDSLYKSYRVRKNIPVRIVGHVFRRFGQIIEDDCVLEDWNVKDAIWGHQTRAWTSSVVLEIGPALSQETWVERWIPAQDTGQDV